jgi:hypothetical protein
MGKLDTAMPQVGSPYSQNAKGGGVTADAQVEAGHILIAGLGADLGLQVGPKGSGDYLFGEGVAASSTPLVQPQTAIGYRWEEGTLLLKLLLGYPACLAAFEAGEVPGGVAGSYDHRGAPRAKNRAVKSLLLPLPHRLAPVFVQRRQERWLTGAVKNNQQILVENRA